jgi:membrane protein DedA with SNARE-associated domain
LSLEYLISQYGALAILIGAGIEGETVVFLGGVLAHRHLLPYWTAALAAATGSFLADQLFFFIGRYASQWPRVQTLLARPGLARVTGLLERYPTGFILAFRFIYGIRTISPLAIGASKVPAGKFVILNAVAALIWGFGITAIGYLFGQGAEQLLGHLELHRHLLVAIGAALAAVAVLGVFIRHRMRRIGAPTS